MKNFQNQTTNNINDFQNWTLKQEQIQKVQGGAAAVGSALGLGGYTEEAALGGSNDPDIDLLGGSNDPDID